jgi:hypothetical protein
LVDWPTVATVMPAPLVVMRVTCSASQQEHHNVTAVQCSTVVGSVVPGP